jgi:NAD(P)-dependent dehydrogenase (short-subunit alcohol dehydrogenase family)
MPTVLVTGASRGIGLAVAKRMHAAGWEVLSGVRRIEDATVGTPVVVDVTDVGPLDLPARLDAVVNNAGIVVGAPIEAIGIDDLRRQLEVNVVGQVAVTQAVLPRLRASGGRIVFMSSVSGRVATPFTGAYAASKYALEATADALRMELRPWGIRVSLVEPGAIDTALWQEAEATLDETLAALQPEHRQLYGQRVEALRKTVRRTAKAAIGAEKVADAVHHALTAPKPKARYLVGTDARVQLAIARALPTRAFDAAISRLTGGR